MALRCLDSLVMKDVGICRDLAEAAMKCDRDLRDSMGRRGEVNPNNVVFH